MATPNIVPRATGEGSLGTSLKKWGDVQTVEVNGTAWSGITDFVASKAAASGLASLNSSSKVVQDPANATATATASKLPIADASGRLDTWVRQGGECRFDYTSSTACTLSRKNGYRLIIDDAVCSIPSGGVTLSNSGLSSDTTYYVYAYMNSGTMSLAASATGYTTDSRNGIPVKSDNAAYTLVGMVYLTGGYFLASQVVSYFNRIMRTATYAMSDGLYSTTSESRVEFTDKTRVSFLCFSGTQGVAFVSGSATATSSYGFITLTRNGSAIGIEQMIATGSNTVPLGLISSMTISADGLQTLSIYGRVTAGTVSICYGTWCIACYMG